MIGRVFVYGTMQPGQLRWPALTPFAIRSDAVPPVCASGRLFDPGYGWPAAVFDPISSDQVPGVVVTLRPESIREALMALDAVEGVTQGLFKRIVIDVGGQLCWAYHWPGPTNGFRRIDCWPTVAE